MKTIEFVDPGYSGEFSRTRRACRGIVLRDGLVLLSHYPASGDLWMIPGGGKEEGETDRDTVIREVAEESGYLIEPRDCALEIIEYCLAEEEKYINMRKKYDEPLLPDLRFISCELFTGILQELGIR